MTEGIDDKVLWAVKNGDRDALKNVEFDVNKHGTSLLVAAADYGQTEMIEYLIRKGADVNKTSNQGITPLLAAIYEDHVEAAKILIAKGALKSGKCIDGSEYIDAAQSDGMKDLLK